MKELSVVEIGGTCTDDGDCVSNAGCGDQTNTCGCKYGYSDKEGLCSKGKWPAFNKKLNVEIKSSPQKLKSIICKE